MEFRCPTCRAPWRHVTLCGRCGTDLSTVMQVARRAWEIREAARQLLWTGDRPAEAVRLARVAYELHATQQAQRLLALTLLANHQTAEAQAALTVGMAGHAAPSSESRHTPDEE
jgi:predicted amidophosphoribosyltransferase